MWRIDRILLTGITQGGLYPGSAHLCLILFDTSDWLVSLDTGMPSIGADAVISLLEKYALLYVALLSNYSEEGAC